MARYRSSRRRRSAAQWAELVARHRRSGLTVKDFASREGVSRSSLFWWRWKLRSVDPPEEPALRLVEVTVDSQPPRAPEGWELTLAGGHSLRVQGALGDDALRTMLALLARSAETR